ncbi:tetratricopeptide repeat protein, partial [Pseudoalteromonas sp. SR44-5]|uniref:tetratricopeptide repeat protein n=1 Tax=Pseudoalteromonas sp. SR44-5 TaxID=2760934 RepID=UPI001603E8BD
MDSDQLGILLNRAVTHHQNNDLNEAAKMYQQILAFLPDTIIVESNDDIDFLDLISKTNNNFALLLKDIGQLADACNKHKQAIILMEAIRSWRCAFKQEWSINEQNDLASAYMNQASIFKLQGAFDDALERQQQAILLREGIRAWCNENNKEWTIQHQNYLGNVYINNANLLDDIGLLDEARLQYQKAIILREKIFSQCGNNEQQWQITYRKDLASAYLNFAILLMRSGVLDKAKEKYQKAVFLYEGIRSWCDDNKKQWPIAHQSDLAYAYLNFTALHITNSVFNDAQETCRKAILLMEDIRRFCERKGQQWPIKYQNNLAGAYVNLSIVHIETGEWNYSYEQLKKAITLMEAICKWYYENSEKWPVRYQEDLALAYMSLGNLLSDTGNLDDAKEQYYNAIYLREGIRVYLDASGQEWTIIHENDLAEAYCKLAIILMDTGELDDAKTIFEQALILRENIRVHCHENERKWSILYQNDLALTYMNRANLLKKQGLLNEARREYQHTILLMVEISMYYDHSGQQQPVAFQNNLAITYMNMALLLQELGALGIAEDRYQQAIRIYDDMFLEGIKNKLPLNIRVNRLIAWLNYFSVVNVPVTESFLCLTSESIELLEIDRGQKSQTASLQLLHRMVAFSLKNNEISLALKLIHCVQGRELAYKLEASQLTGNEPEVV